MCNHNVKNKYWHLKFLNGKGDFSESIAQMTPAVLQSKTGFEQRLTQDKPRTKPELAQNKIQ